MNNLQHERITVLAQDLRLTALPDLYGGIAQNAANKKDVSYADTSSKMSSKRRTMCPVPRNTDADGGLPSIKDAGGL
jgi:hypothetical protein